MKKFAPVKNPTGKGSHQPKFPKAPPATPGKSNPLPQTHPGFKNRNETLKK